MFPVRAGRGGGVNGRRVYGNPDVDWLYNLEPGDYACAPGGKVWYCRTPNGALGNLGAHAITEHEDRTITVSPSILVSSAGPERPGWHGFLERGVWREC